jgi:hypothetical protein
MTMRNRVGRWRARTLAEVVVLALAAGPAAAGVVTIVNADGPGEGLNDPTPAAPVGGNAGTTVGAQRLIALQHAGDIWGATLGSPIPIVVRVDWGLLDCAPASGFLGFAGAENTFRDFSGAPRAATWFPVAEANKLAGTDLDAGNVDVGASFNSEVGTAGCLTGFTWYYGIDNGADPATQFDLVTTALHEFAHGLAQLSFVGSSGATLGGFMDIYSSFLFDNTQGLGWADMNDAQRAASYVNPGNVVWNGATVTAEAPTILDNRPELRVNAPAAIAGTYSVGTASFGPSLTLSGLSGNVTLADDGSATTSDACQPIVNALAGNVALIDRGGCTFVIKVKNAQDAGAIAVIVVNNVAGPPGGMGGADPTITIPAVMVSQADGNAIRAQLASGVHVTMQLDPSSLAGTDAVGRVKVYTPNPLEGGSSVHHWDRTTTPNLLMEPSINPGLPHTGDLTVALARDIGWYTTPSSVELADGRTVLDVPFVSEPGGQVQIRYRLGGAAAPVRLDIHDVAGRRMRLLVQGMQAPGEHVRGWDRLDDAGRPVARGIYFVRLVTGRTTVARKFALLH